MTCDTTLASTTIFYEAYIFVAAFCTIPEYTPSAWCGNSDSPSHCSYMFPFQPTNQHIYDATSLSKAHNPSIRQSHSFALFSDELMGPFRIVRIRGEISHRRTAYPYIVQNPISAVSLHCAKGCVSGMKTTTRLMHLAFGVGRKALAPQPQCGGVAGGAAWASLGLS